MSFMSVGKVVKEMGLLAHEKPSRPPPTFSTGDYVINKVHAAIIVIPPIIIATAVMMGLPLMVQTKWAFVFFVFFAGLGVTTGYHRLFAHCSFTAHPALQWVLAFAGSGAMQGSVKWWARNHRIHHRYIDTDKDPYNALRGFWFSHVGWMLMKQDYEILGRVDMGDLNCNPIIKSQHRNYFPLAMLSGIILPTLVCGLGWGDWVGGYVYAALFKMVFVHHCTFCINSLAHMDVLGAFRNYSNNHSSYDSFLCALVTMGEGYHNFHHEFSQDYRNGIKWYHWDPTKWLIRTFEFVGIAHNVVRTPTSVIERNYYNTHHQYHAKKASACASRVEDLEKQTSIPTSASWSWTEVTERCARGEKLMVIGNYVIDLNKKIPTGAGYTHASQNIVWYKAHPGGRKLLDMHIGKDASEAFTGSTYKHSEGATNLLKHLRVATVQHDFSANTD